MGADSAPPGMNWGEAVNLGVPLFFPQSSGLGREGGRAGPRLCSSVLYRSLGFWGGGFFLSVSPTHNTSWLHISPVASKLESTGRILFSFCLSNQIRKHTEPVKRNQLFLLVRGGIHCRRHRGSCQRSPSHSTSPPPSSRWATCRLHSSQGP